MYKLADESGSGIVYWGMDIRSVTLLVFLFAIMPALGQTSPQDRPYYMWVDDNGVLNFSQIMPRDRVATEIAPRPWDFGRIRPTETEAQSPQKNTPLPPDVESRIAEMDANSDRGREVNCSIGRRTLEKLNRFRNIYMMDEEGMWRELSPERREQQVRQSEQLIAENCP